ncbi:pentatricopeptide repeat-containing At3g49170, chloroplastic, partial [Olea europaea subsp. europaea]
MEDARKAFEFLFERNLISYNALIDGYARNSDSNEALELYIQIDGSRIGPDVFTFASLLSRAASVGAVGKGERIHAQLLKSGFESNQCVANALIYMYTRCGNIEAAFQVFEQMEDRNVISWTSIITGFSKHGFAKRSLELFKQMLDFGAKPNEVTYITVLSACSHAEHRIHPRMEHYACMVDLLGRSGFLEEAIQFINSLYFIIKLACFKWSWGKVAKIRKFMKERNLVKEAGCSWMEAENKVHKFYVGDTKHPQTRDIYEELDRLLLEIKEMGYLPNTDFVLHEVEVEQKEQYLFQHSEKIALAFGLISTQVNQSPLGFLKIFECVEI